MIASGACNLASVPALRQGVPSLDRILHDVRLSQSRAAARRRCAGGGRLRDRRAAGRRNSTLRAPGDALGRRTCPAAENLSWPRRAVVDGRVRRLESAVRRDRGARRARAAAVAATGRHAGACHAGAQHAERGGRRDRRATGRRTGRAGPLLGWAPQPVRAGRSEDGSTAGPVRRVGERPRPRWRCRRPRALRGHARTGLLAARSRSRAAAKSDPSSGPQVFDPTTAGSMCRSSIARAACDTTAAWSTRPVCTRLDCQSSAAASRRSSTARRTTPETWSIILPVTSTTGHRHSYRGARSRAGGALEARGRLAGADPGVRAVKDTFRERR